MQSTNTHEPIANFIKKINNYSAKKHISISATPFCVKKVLPAKLTVPVQELSTFLEFTCVKQTVGPDCSRW